MPVAFGRYSLSLEKMHTNKNARIAGCGRFY